MFIVKDDNQKKQADIRIVGVGGGGNNALETMIKEGVKGVQFIAVNTDNQALEASSAGVKVQIGSKITKGLGAGANPEVGRRAAVESYEEIVKVLKGADMVFVTAGMGGGTGTGAAPFVAQAAKELDLLTVGIVTKPFIFEGYKRMSQAKKGIGELTQHVDTLIVIPNEQLLNLAEKDTPLLEAFKLTDDVLLQAVKGIAELVSVPGLINLDFADIKTVMKDKGMALMGRGTAKGPDRAQKAIQSAVSSPLLSGVLIKGATGMIVNLTSDSSLSLMELNSASSLLTEMADPSADIIVGTVIDEKMNGELSVTVIATGFENHEPTFEHKRTLKTEDSAQNTGLLRESQSVEERSLTEDSMLASNPQVSGEPASNSQVLGEPASNSQVLGDSSSDSQSSGDSARLSDSSAEEQNSDLTNDSQSSAERLVSQEANSANDISSATESANNSQTIANLKEENSDPNGNSEFSAENPPSETSKEESTENSEAMDLTGATQSSTEESSLENPERETQDKESPQNFNISADSQSAKENLSSTSSKEKKSESVNFSKNSQPSAEKQDSVHSDLASNSQSIEGELAQSQQATKLQSDSDDSLGKDTKNSVGETSSSKEDSSQDKISTDPPKESFNHSISSNKESINKKEVSLRESLLSKAKAYQESLIKKKSKRDDHQIDMEWPKKQEELSSPFEADLEFSDEDML